MTRPTQRTIVLGAALAFLLCMGTAQIFAKKPSPSPTSTPPPAAIQATPAPQGESSEPRSRVLELAGAFGNEGYKLRDGFWFGALEPGKPVLIEVNLFAGNEYWFCLAANEQARKIQVSVFDENGRPVQGNHYQEGPTAAAGIVAEVSGRYFIRLELREGTTADACFLYAYK